MQIILKELLFFIYKRLKLLWILLTIFLLLVFSYTNWYSSIRNSFSLIQETANKLAHNVDDFFNDMFQDLYRIPLYERKHLICQSDFDPYLQHIIMNNPAISSLIIHDQKHQILCSTLPHNQTFFLGKDKNQRIVGPLKVPTFHHQVYVILKKIYHYQLEIIIMASVLQNILPTPDKSSYSITLYDENENKNVIKIEHKESHSWLYKKFIENQSPFISQKIFATAKLSSLDGVLVIVTERGQTIVIDYLYNQFLFSLAILIISIFLYFLIKNQFNKHYSLYGAIKKAIKSRQFYPVYQPLFDTKTSIYSGAEVLLRWQDNKDKTIMPDFFIEEAEDTGLIVPITLQIIEIALKEAKVILNNYPEFHLSFNICALHFRDERFFNEFYKLMERYSIAPKQILLEITERDLLDKNHETSTQKMQELRKKGYSLAIDDYGTGHSSISYLHYFPFNFLKIDKLFIQAIGTKAITETLNDAIINLAKKINLTIIAEGVETTEQVNYLLQHKVRFLQGWYFSRALSIEQLIDLLKGENK